MAKGKATKAVSKSKSRNYIDQVLAAHNRSGAGLTADNFLKIWKHYDKDGNNRLERSEIHNFIKDLFTSSEVGLGDISLTPEEEEGLKSTFMAEFDQNQDGKITIRELSAVLAPDERFFLLFRLDTGAVKTGIDYMNVWNKYDTDYSGYIELNELKELLRDIITSVKKGQAPDEDRLDACTKTVMETFDLDENGKLGLSELSRMLPAEENFVQQVIDKDLHLNKLTRDDVLQIASVYDKNGNGYLEENELSNLVRDVLIKTQTNFYNPSDAYEFEQALLKGCDLNQDGRLSTKELAAVIYAIGQSEDMDDEVADPSVHHAKRVYQGRKGQHISSYVPV